MDSFDGTIESSGPDIGGFGNTGNANGSGDSTGGYSTTGTDIGALAAAGATAFGPWGAVFGTLAMSGIAQLTGVNPFSAAVNLIHDMSLSLGTNLAANPAQLAGLFIADSSPVAGIEPVAGDQPVWTFGGQQ